MKRIVVLVAMFLFISGCSFVQQRLPCFLPGVYEEQVSLIDKLQKARAEKGRADGITGEPNPGTPQSAAVAAPQPAESAAPEPTPIAEPEPPTPPQPEPTPPGKDKDMTKDCSGLGGKR